MNSTMKSTIRRLINTFGYDIQRKPAVLPVFIKRHIWEPLVRPNWMMQLYFEGIKRSQNEWTDNFYKQLRFYSLQQIALYVLRQKLAGDFVECGVWKGHSAYMISSILRKHESNKTLHLFDAFEEGGLSNKKEKDKNLVRDLSEKAIREESDMMLSVESEVRACLNNFEFVRFYKGWIPDRFSEVEDRQFSFVHVDVDLHEATSDIMNFFYPRLVKNGAIVCNDYGLTQFPGPKRAIDKFMENNSHKLFYEVPMGGCFIIK